MPGSTSDPVILDPWQNIIEVHWPPRITHIAFEIRLGLSASGAEDNSCDGSGVPMPEEGAHWSDYLTDLGYAYAAGDPVNSIRLYVDGEWIATNVADSGVTVSSFPTLPTLTFGAWDKVFGGGAFNGQHINGAKGRWAPPSGGSLAVPVPGYGDEFFINTPAADFSVYGDEYTGAPFCIEDFTTRKWAPCTGTTDVEGYTNAVEYAADSFSIAGMTVTHPNSTTPKNYVPRGVALIGGNDFKAGKDFNAILWLLFERDDL